MKIVFVHPVIDSLGVEYLSAVLRGAGHETGLVFDPMLFMDQVFQIQSLHELFSFRKGIGKEVVKRKPGLVCFSVVSDNYAWACETAKEIKSRIDVPIVFGGIHPTSVPERVIRNDFVDFVVVGEGEHALLELADSLEGGKPVHNIRNVWSKNGEGVIRNEVRPLIENLDLLPFPDKELFRQTVPRFYDRYTIITSRGCPYSCSYCNNSLMKRLYRGKGVYLRRRSPGNVIDELRLAKEVGARQVVFHDETFNHDMGWLRDFSERYRDEIGLPFFCWINPSMVNEDVVRLLKEAGCACVEIGVQTHNREIGERVLNRRCSEVDTKRAIALMKREGIYTITDNMAGLPLQGVDDLIGMVEFYNRNRVDFIQLYWLRYFPKTEIVDISRRLGIINEARIEAIEESKGTSPFTHEGDTFNREVGRVSNLFPLMSILPERAISFLIKHRLYRFFPSRNVFFLMMLAKKPRNLFSRKKRVPTDLTTRRFLYYYLYFIFMRIFRKNDG
jgi:anaerobic magnesium-protoporphyrin IX monomethyl ester cyclase